MGATDPGEVRPSSDPGNKKRAIKARFS